MQKILTKVAMAAVAVVGVSTSAQAYVFMRLADLNAALAIQTSADCNTSMAQNNAAGGNCSTLDGFTGYSLGGNGIAFNGTVGSFSVFTTSGFGDVPGTPTTASLDTSSTRISNTSGIAGLDNFYIDFRGLDFLFPAGASKTLFGSASHSSTSPGAGESVNTFFYADPTNAGGTTVEGSCAMVVTFNNSCNSGAPIVWSDVGLGTFSLRSQQYVQLNAGSVVNTTTSVIAGAIPEPMTLSLVGAALLAAGVASRRRANKA